jgi:hypothetical protein
MDPVKVVVFVAFFLLFLLVVRRLFSTEQPYHEANSLPPPPHPFPYEQEFISEKPGTLTGAELPFPIHLPPVQEHDDGGFNRPNILNYYFEQTDLVRGPENSNSFYDRFFIQFQSPDKQFTWTAEYTVATPSGLDALLNSEHQQSMLLAGPIVVVSSWNLAEIMTAVMNDVMEKHETPLQPRSIREYPEP